MESEWQKIYVQHYQKLVRQAAFLLGDISMAEDLAQEAFIRLHKIGLSNIVNPTGWLTKVIHNLCYDHMRSEGNRRKREEKFSLPLLAHSAEANSAENLVIDREDVRLVQLALQSLQPRDRLVLLMKFSGYGYEEIATATEMNKSSVGTILARARERFKRVYQEKL